MELTRLDSSGSAVVDAGGALLGLVESRLLGVRGGLLLHLVSESLAAGLC